MYLGIIVETSRTEDLFQEPLHPYTRALLAALPQPDPHKRHTLATLQGDVPSPVHLPPGCRFHPRCPQRVSICSLRAPDMLEVRPGHWTACHKYGN
jgi:peptide/nickel transport system ATP-binding protein/oligopeptide transport system ATP-binding protein